MCIRDRLLPMSCQKPVEAPSNIAVAPAQRPSEDAISNKADVVQKIDGMTIVAPPNPFPANPFLKVKAIHTNWVGIIPYAYTRQGKPSVSFGNSSWQWWGETIEGATASIEQAHKEGLLVLLKPQVYIPGSWPGGMTYETETEWTQWERDYELSLIHI